jgi:hypothetical protein
MPEAAPRLARDLWESASGDKFLYASQTTRMNVIDRLALSTPNRVNFRNDSRNIGTATVCNPRLGDVSARIVEEMRRATAAIVRILAWERH